VGFAPSEDYAHRQNEDGTFDSICVYCFGTIASAKREVDLAEGERRHTCSSKAASLNINRRDDKKS